jgi:hypothetical protein
LEVAYGVVDEEAPEEGIEGESREGVTADSIMLKREKVVEEPTAAD